MTLLDIVGESLISLAYNPSELVSTASHGKYSEEQCKIFKAPRRETRTTARNHKTTDYRKHMHKPQAGIQSIKIDPERGECISGKTCI